MAIIVRNLDASLPGSLTQKEIEADQFEAGPGIHTGVAFNNAHVIITSDPRKPFSEIATIVIHNTETGERIVVELC